MADFLEFSWKCGNKGTSEDAIFNIWILFILISSSIEAGASEKNSLIVWFGKQGLLHWEQCLCSSNQVLIQLVWNTCPHGQQETSQEDVNNSKQVEHEKGIFG